MTTPDRETLLYLSRHAVEAAMPAPGELIAAVEAAFRAQAEGAVRVGPKAGVPIGTGHFFHSLGGALDRDGIAGLKWFGITPDNAARGLPNICALIVLNDIETGLPLAVMDGNAITGARTAAMTAVAAKYLVPPTAERIAFIGCGVQARSHAVFLRAVLPGLSQAVLLGRGIANRDAFAAELDAAGWHVEIAASAEAALEGAEIVVSTVPESPGFRPFLDPRRLMPGAFVAAVDLGRSWLPDYGAFDLIATDDAKQGRGLVEEGRLKSPADFGADLASLASGNAPARQPDDRVYFVYSGHVLGDLAAAAAVYRGAVAQGLGTTLPR